MSNHLPSRRWGPFRQEFYSLHSFGPCKEADTEGVCPHGTWNNVLGLKLSGMLFKASPKLWRIWANRPLIINRSKRFLKSQFPNLK